MKIMEIFHLSDMFVLYMLRWRQAYKYFLEVVSIDKMTENERKKEYLKRYREHIRNIRRIEEEIAELRTMKVSISVNNDGMPHGSGQCDLSDYAAELDRLEHDLLRERYHRVAAYKEISGQIKSLSDEMERDVLFYRYIKGRNWWEIAEKMGYSERQIHRYHGNALAHFQIPETEKMS